MIAQRLRRDIGPRQNLRRERVGVILGITLLLITTTAMVFVSQKISRVIPDRDEE